MFEATQEWSARGYGIVRYRFPGLDGRSLHPPLRIRDAAQEIVSLLARYPEKPVRILGFSTGGAIALETARHLSGDVRVALMSPALPRAGGGETATRSAIDLIQSAWRARSLRVEPVWLCYYEILLFGRSVREDPVLTARAQAIIEARRARIVFPNRGKPRAHVRDLRRWMWKGRSPVAQGCLRIFTGDRDPVFSGAQTGQFAAQLGAVPLRRYPGQGHLLFLSYPQVFADVLAFFEEEAGATGGGILGVSG